MRDFFMNSAFFGVAVSLAAYMLGVAVQKKWRLVIFNPLLISVGITIGILLLTGVDYAAYERGARLLNSLLLPATVCLSISLYEKIQLLRRNLKAILIGIAAGVLANLTSILLLALLFGLNGKDFVSVLPKSTTTAIGTAISEAMGGSAAVAAVVIACTGIAGNMFAESILKIARVTDPVAKGVAIGTASHAIGTAKAMEMGEVEGAMSGLSIAVSGLFTVALIQLFFQWFNMLSASA